MYENQTKEIILARMLEEGTEWARKKGLITDTREGSLIKTASSGSAIEHKLMYIELDEVLNEAFVDTASREFLIEHCKERGIFVDEATKAIRQGEFSIDVKIGARFSLNQLNYVVLEKIDIGIFKLECETPGIVGNHESGPLIPIDYIDGLEWAKLTDVLIPGEDEETTEHLRQKYYDSLESKAFGGNIADYKKKILALPGVEGVKVYPTFKGGYKPSDLLAPIGTETWINGLSGSTDVITWIKRVFAMISEGVVTVGAGTVKIIIINSLFEKPSETLIDEVQTVLDPEQNQGMGLGLAPIGHVVTVHPVEEFAVNIETHFTYQPGWDWVEIQPYVENVIDQYFLELAKEWDQVDWENNPEDTLVVRISQIETRFLSLVGILDVQNTTLNGVAQNIILDPDSIPIRGDIIDA